MCRTRVARSPWKIAVATSRINPAQVRLSVLESSRTSNGLTLKAVKHPRGTLINYILPDLVTRGNPHEKWAESYNIHQSFAEAKYHRVFSLQTVNQIAAERNKVFNDF